MNPLFLLELENFPIFEQLQIEEALLRVDARNICIINSGSAPAVVMGISGKLERLINQTLAAKHTVPIIKRFSGGGTVYVDEHTLFVTFILNSKGPPFPHTIMKWSEEFYKPIFGPEFALRENDYVFGEKKFGGNAQYIAKNRYLHHTSFLWDYNVEKMGILKMPEKRPTYRGERAHHEFLCTLKERYETKKVLLERLKQHLCTRFEMRALSLDEAHALQERPHRKSSILMMCDGRGYKYLSQCSHILGQAHQTH